ncbi:MAG TPA: cysteine synthase family protein [Stellaceae bacterium]|nr:cysteine synthase family protein [Stellaceae bacterium]
MDSRMELRTVIPMPPPAMSLLAEVGKTPLVALDRLFTRPGIRVLAKLEFFNPSGSIKDRIVRHIVADAEARGLLRPGSTIVENTSGNTGAAIAMIAALRGYRAVLTMPDKVSKEKQDALRALGATVVLCPTGAAPDSDAHYVRRARAIAAATPGAFVLDQYNNPKNPEAHYLTTGPEIWEQSGGKVDYFVAAGSTGGTVSGTGRFLKERNPRLKVVLPDPRGSIYHRYFNTGAYGAEDIATYQVEGIGEDHLVKCMDFGVIDEVLQFRDSDAFGAARELAAVEGILGGGSGGANIWACQQLAARLEAPATIVTVIPDSGLKYLSKFFNDDWMRANGHL